LRRSVTWIAGWSTATDYGTLRFLPFACVDIGSNTTRLLVAEVEEGRLREIAAIREFTLLGSGLAHDGSIPRLKIEETAAAVAAQVDSARRLGVQLISVVGTAVLRTAPNAGELGDEVERLTGFPLRVLPEEAEAELSFLGATSCTDVDCGGAVAVADVGGGSSELAIGRLGQRPDWWHSIATGSAALARECLRSDPPGPEQIRQCRERAAAAVRALDPPPVELGLAVGGSANSLRLLAGGQLDQRALATVFHILAHTDSEQVAAEAQIDARRVRLLPAGLAILAEIAALLDVPLDVARGGLREGVVLRLAATAS
jgi:exopolyphosphatase/guanosine-5'-triphosphate,3'-diphosphate pyrophosphatase